MANDTVIVRDIIRINLENPEATFGTIWINRKKENHALIYDNDRDHYIVAEMLEDGSYIDIKYIVGTAFLKSVTYSTFCIGSDHYEVNFYFK